MKTICIVIVLLMASCQLNAQAPPDEPKEDFKMDLSDVEWVVIESDQTILLESNDSNNLVIPGYNEIEQDVKLRKNENENDQGYFVFKTGKNLIIKDLRRRGTSTTLFLPKDQKIKALGRGLHNMYFKNFSGNIDATTIKSGNVTLNDCTGAAIINTYMGNIFMYFEIEDLKSSISAISSSGNILLSLPKDTAATVDLEAGTSKVQSHFKIIGRSIKTIGEKVKGNINGGGPKIMLATTFNKITIKTSAD